MGYFPFFVDLREKEGLIVGGGTVALRKIEKLLPYGPRLTVAAPHIREEILRIPGIRCLETSFGDAMLEGKLFVIAATDEQEQNSRIAGLCREKGILVNVVDCKEECTFLFPCLVKEGRLSVGISTEGASPSGAIYIKKQMEQWIPEHFDEILEFLESKRKVVKEVIPKEKGRSRFFAQLLEQCVEKGRAMTEEEFQEELRQEPAASRDGAS